MTFDLDQYLRNVVDCDHSFGIHHVLSSDPPRNSYVSCCLKCGKAKGTGRPNRQAFATMTDSTQLRKEIEDLFHDPDNIEGPDGQIWEAVMIPKLLALIEREEEGGGVWIRSPCFPVYGAYWISGEKIEGHGQALPRLQIIEFYVILRAWLSTL